MWLWVSVGVLAAILLILLALYRDSLKNPRKRTQTEVVGTPS